MEKLERELNTPAIDWVSVSDFNRFLAKVSPEADKMPQAPKLHRVISAKLCALLCSYKLCDVVYSLKNPGTGFKNPRYPRLNQSGLRPSSVVSFTDQSTRRMTFLLSTGRC